MIIQGNFGGQQAPPPGMPGLPPGMAPPSGMPPQQQVGMLSPSAPRWAEFVQMGNWQQLGIVDPERAARMTERDLVQWVTSCREESAAAQAQLLPYWDYYDDLYNLRTWDADKQDWQAQIVVPEVRNKVRIALSMIQGGLLDSPDLLKVINEAHPWDDDAVQFIQRMLSLIQRDSGLIESYLAALEDGLLFGSGCMGLSLEDTIDRRPHVQDPTPQDMQAYQQAFYWAQMQGQMPPPQPQPQVIVSPERRHRFQWKHKHLRSMFPDPYGHGFYDGKYVIEESEADEDDLQDMVDAGFYDSIDDIGEPQGAKSERNYRQRQNDLALSNRTTRRRHGIQDFVGNIYDRDGHIVAKNWVLTVVNERALVRCGPTPTWSGKRRYIWTTPLPFAGRVWGRSLIDADAHVQVAVTSYLNLALDDLKYVVLGAFNWDSSIADEPTVPDTIEPGKIFSGRGPNVLTKLQFSTNANQMWPVIRELYDIGGKSTQIGEWADGTPTSRGRPSAKEVVTKTAAGTAYLHGMMRNLERNDLEPAFQLMYEHAMQFGADTSEPRLGALLQEYGGPQWFNDPIARLSYLDKSFRIKVGSISMLMDRQSIIDRVEQLAQLTMQMGLPPPNQIDVLYTLISALGFSPDQFGYPPTPQAMMQMMAQMAAQQAQAGQAGGPGSGAPSGIATASPQGSAPAAPSQAPPNPNVGMPQGAAAA